MLAYLKIIIFTLFTLITITWFSSCKSNYFPSPAIFVAQKTVCMDTVRPVENLDSSFIIEKTNVSYNVFKDVEMPVVKLITSSKDTLNSYVDSTLKKSNVNVEPSELGLKSNNKYHNCDKFVESQLKRIADETQLSSSFVEPLSNNFNAASESVNPISYQHNIERNTFAQLNEYSTMPGLASSEVGLQNDDNTILQLQGQIQALQKQLSFRSSTSTTANDNMGLNSSYNINDLSHKTNINTAVGGRSQTVRFLQEQVRNLQNQLRLASYIQYDAARFQFPMQLNSLSNLQESANMLQYNNNIVEALNDEIQNLRNKLNAYTNSVYDERIDSFKVVRNASNLVSSSFSINKSQSDSIKSLREQVLALRNNSKSHTGIKPEVKMSKVPVNQQNIANENQLQALLANKIDSLKLLRKQIVELQANGSVLNAEIERRNQIAMPLLTVSDDSSVTANEVAETFNPNIGLTNARDTVIFFAYYNLGFIKPNLLNQIVNDINELNANKNIDKIILSGFTDSSGSAKVNEAITDKRLKFFRDIVMDIVSIEKIFHQNFADRFSSVEKIDKERRLEIKVILNK